MKLQKLTTILLALLFIFVTAHSYAEVKIQLIRNATLKISYAGKTILVDPMLSAKGTFESFAGIERNPTVKLPMLLEEITGDIDFVLLTHNHPDHWDKTAAEQISKDIPFLVQQPDAEAIKGAGFHTVIPIVSSIYWEDIAVKRTGGKHGSDEILKAVPLLGTVSGFMLSTAGYPDLYVMGDTLLTDEIRQNLEGFKEGIIVMNTGGAKLPVKGFENEMILMDADAAVEAAKLAPDAHIIAVHMEAIDHCTVRRADLREAVTKAGISTDRFRIPLDGEVLMY